MKSIVIVGAGTAALSCARELRKLNKQVSISIVTQDDAEVYSKPMLSNALAKHMSPAALVTSDASQIGETLDAKVYSATCVDKLDISNKTIHSGSRQFDFDRLVLALGASQRDVGIANPQQVTIHQINHIHDYVKFRHDLEGKKQVVIIGAGLIGCEFANDLLAAGYACTVVAPASQPLHGLLPPRAGEFFRQRLAAQGVSWHFGAKASRVGKSAAGIAVQLENGDELEAELLLSAVGLQANTGLAQAAGLKTGRGIVVDHYLQTSASDIYALGDCAELDGKLWPFILPIMHGARALAATLNGDKTVLNYPHMPVVVKTPACPTVILPPPESEGEWQCDEEDDGMCCLFRDKQDTILGFALLGGAISQRQQILKQMTS